MTTRTVASSMAAKNERPATLPSWATGDPFFDTMAGRDPKEYQNLYKTGEGAEQAGVSLEGQMAGLSTNITADQGGEARAKDGSGTEEEQGVDPNIGLAYWNRRREEWTGGQWNAVESKNKDNPMLKVFEMSSKHVGIYDSLVYEKRRLQKPIPLPLVVSVLVSGWKSEGLWQEAAATSAAEPSTPHGITAHVPGFSSTTSKPVKVQPSHVQPSHVQPSDVQLSNGQPSNMQSTDGQPAGAQSSDAQPAKKKRSNKKKKKSSAPQSPASQSPHSS